MNQIVSRLKALEDEYGYQEGAFTDVLDDLENGKIVCKSGFVDYPLSYAWQSKYDSSKAIVFTEGDYFIEDLDDAIVNLYDRPGNISSIDGCYRNFLFAEQTAWQRSEFEIPDTMKLDMLNDANRAS